MPIFSYLISANPYDSVFIDNFMKNTTIEHFLLETEDVGFTRRRTHLAFYVVQVLFSSTYRSFSSTIRYLNYRRFKNCSN